MKFVPMRELKIHTSAVMSQAKRGDVIVTRNGKPAVALLAVDEDTLEEFILARHPAFLREIAEARREFRAKGGISIDEMRKRLRRRRAAA